MNDSMLILYAVLAVCWAFRISGLRRMMGISRFHGPDWWFDSRVPPDFYAREGKDLLRRMRLRLLMPYCIEIPLTVLAYLRWGILAVGTAMAAGAVVGAAFATATLKGAAYAGRPYALADQKPATAMPLSLQPRTADNYRNPWLDAILRAVIAVATLGLAYACVYPARHMDVVTILTPPSLVFYVLIGLSLLRLAAREWRIGIASGVDPELYLTWQNATRRQLLRNYDWLRASAVLFLAGWTVLCVRPASWPWHTTAAWALQYPMLAIWIVMIIFLRRSRDRFLALSKRAKPDGWRAPAPAPVEGRYYLAGRLCFLPQHPTMLLRGPRGAALNASHRRARLWFAYLGGWVVLAVTIGILHR